MSTHARTISSVSGVGSGKQLVSLSVIFFLSPAAAAVAGGGFACPSMDSEQQQQQQLNAVLVPGSNENEMNYHGMFHVGGEGSSDGTSPSLPFSWQ